MSTLCRRFKDEEGVSEVVGTILTLGITVVLFSSVYAAVTNLESPEQRDHVEMVVDYERIGVMDHIEITHQSGRSLDTGSLIFNLYADGASEHRFRIDEDYEDVYVNITGDSETWSVGERVTIEGEIFEDTDTDLELIIQNEDTNRVVYQTRLVEEVPDQLGIKNAYISYIHDWRNYAEQGEKIDIVAMIRNPDDEDIWVNASVAGDDNPLTIEADTIELEKRSANRYIQQEIEIAAGATEKPYSVEVTVENRTAERANEYIRLNVGKRPAERYPKELEIANLRYSPSSPSHGDDLTINADVYNQGPENYTADWEITDYHRDKDGVVVESGSTKIEHGPAPTEIRATFNIEGTDRHEIKLEVLGDDEWEGSERSVIIHVDPHILLVEDRSARELHEVELMSNALSGLNIDYDIREVGDEYEEGTLNFEEHSMVIWMTGNQTGNDYGPLLEEAAGNLVDYIEENNGTLWIKGTNWYESLDDDLIDKVGFSSHDVVVEDEGYKTLSGQGGTFGDFEFDISSEYEYFHMGLEDVEEENELNDKEDDHHYGAGYETEEGQRTVVSSFLFEQIIDSGLRTALVGEVIQWTTNITARSGIDVAVTSQKIEPRAPMYMDTINITATFRNNGPRDLTLNNTARLVRNQGEEIITPPEDAGLFMEANGGTARVTFEWVADELGVHELIVKADYFGDIDQVNPNTNDITYKNLEISDDDIYANVHYSTLVVDADLSDVDNNDVDDYHDTAGEVINSLKLLGYEEGSDYDVHEVGIENNGQLQEGPSYNTMSNYNSVFWITGERGYEDDEFDIFHENDINEIEEYLEQDTGANMMFMGEYILDYLAEEDEEDLMEYMGVSSISDEREETEVLVGQESNAMGRSLRYELEEINDELNYTTFETNSDGEVLFQGEENHNFASNYDDGSMKTIYMGINIERINGSLVAEDLFEDWPAGEVDPSNESNARTEFVYTSLWYFGKMDERPELRVTDYDIRFSADHPHTGRSYHIRAEVENYGYRGVSAQVRFYDGDDYIGSESLFLDRSERESEEDSTYFDVSTGTATAEVTWRTSNPGDRPIVVQVDPEGELEEIVDENNEDNSMMEFNNQAKVTHPVYFFWDDMEDGRENWDTEATIMNINGEHPLEYLDVDYDPAYTEIIHDWEYKHEDIPLTDHFSYSDPYSFWIQEPKEEVDFDDEETTSSLSTEQTEKDETTTENNEITQDYSLMQNDVLEFELVDNGIFMDSFDYWALTREENDGDAGWSVDSHPETEGGSIYASADAEGEGNESTEKAYWTQEIGPTSEEITVNGAYNIDISTEGHQEAIASAYTNASILVYDTGIEDWDVIYYEEYDKEDGDGISTGWEEFGPDKAYEPVGDVTEIRVYMYIKTEGAGEPGDPQGEQEATGNIKMDNISVTVEEEIDEIVIEPAEETIILGESQEYTATAFVYAYDDEDEIIGIIGEEDITEKTGWSIEEGEEEWWDENVLTIEENGEWTIIGEYGELEDTGTLIVLDPDYIEIEPKEKIVQEGETVVYTSWAYDEELDEGTYVTGETEWEIEDDAGGELVNNVYTSENLGVWTVTGTYTYDEEDMTANATLSVRSDEMAYGENENKTAVTPTLNLEGYEEARLTLRSKYRMNSSTAGGFIMVGVQVDNNNNDYEWITEDEEGNEWAWRYAIPSESTYNSEFDNDEERKDSFGNQMDFAWSGTSGGGSFTWERARLNILRYVEEGYENNVRIKFNYTQYGGEGTGYGWYIDDVRTTISRGLNDLEEHHRDVWRQVEVEGRDGSNTTAWWNAHPTDPEGEYLKSGIDNSLITSSIDLTNARSVELSAYLKFNINNESGAPPDGFRVEVSTDGGRRWMPINTGTRAAFGVSGSGEDDSNQGYNVGNNWTSADSLSRLDTDLSDFRGEIIHLRFRMVTTTYQHYEDSEAPPGFYVDEVVVSGN